MNSNEEFEEVGKGWGTDFNGDYIFVIEDIPVDEYHIKDLPEELIQLKNMPEGVWEGVPDNIREQMLDQMGDMPVYEFAEKMPDEIREALPEDTKKLLEETEELFDQNPTYSEASEVMTDRVSNFLPEELKNLMEEQEEFITDDGKVYTFIGLEDGKCTGVEILQIPDEREAGFVLHGDYEAWKDLSEGGDVVQAVMSGKLELDGNMQKILEYTDAAQMMGNISAEIDAKYIF
ncbi:MAG: SCP2 sterol-binding domain-containing protein [Halobacteria archaeon]|nr:SCP2 sterol-binding domain-containing protein [Halobacteria archaeon]